MKQAIEMSRKYRLQKIQQIKDSMTAKKWEKAEEIVVSILFGSAIIYFGIYYLIYLIK